MIALYEVNKKQTFLVFFVDIFLNASVLLGMMVLYPKLGMKQRILKNQDTESSTGTENESESDDEVTKLAPDATAK